MRGNMKRIWRKIVDSFQSEVYPPRPAPREYLTAAERKAIRLTAEGNVYLAMGLVCTPRKVADMKRDILDYIGHG